LSPRDRHLPLFHDLRARAHLSLGEIEEAAAFARKAVRLPNASYRPYAALVAALGLLGRAEEARVWRAELLQRVPAYSCAYARADFAFGANEALVERFVAGLRQAGIPDGAEPAVTPPPASAPVAEPRPAGQAPSRSGTV